MNPPEPNLYNLTNDERAWLDAQRAVCLRFVNDPQSLANVQNTSAGKLGLLRALLAAGLNTPAHQVELQAMGVLLGNVFAAELGMQWVAVEDEYGRTPALIVPGTSIIIYPLTMLTRRIEKGEGVDVFALFNGLAGQIEEIRRKQHKQ